MRTSRTLPECLRRWYNSARLNVCPIVPPPLAVMAAQRELPGPIRRGKLNG